jgi:hypothetical protein
MSFPKNFDEALVSCPWSVVSRPFSVAPWSVVLLIRVSPRQSAADSISLESRAACVSR